MAEEITTQILIQIREDTREIREELRATNARIDDLRMDVDRRFDDVGQSLNIGRIVLQAIDTRLSRLEDTMAFLPRRVDVLEQKVARIEGALGLDRE